MFLVLSVCAVLGEAYLFSLLLSNPVVDTDGRPRDLERGSDLDRKPGRSGVRSHERRSQAMQERDTNVDIALELAVAVSTWRLPA